MLQQTRVCRGTRPASHTHTPGSRQSCKIDCLSSGPMAGDDTQGIGLDIGHSCYSFPIAFVPCRRTYEYRQQRPLRLFNLDFSARERADGRRDCSIKSLGSDERWPRLLSAVPSGLPSKRRSSSRLGRRSLAQSRSACCGPFPFLCRDGGAPLQAGGLLRCHR